MAERPPVGDPYLFSRKFKELVAGEQQGAVAVRMGYTQSRVSQVMRGEKPSREFVERLIEAYDLPRDEWLALGGYGPRQESPPDPSEERIAQRVAELIGEKADPNELLAQVIERADELHEHYESIEEEFDIRGFRGSEKLGPKTIETVNRIMRAIISEERKKQGRD